MILLKHVYLPLPVGAFPIKFAVLAGREMVTQAVEAFGDTNVACAFLASLAEFLVVLIVMAFTAFRATEDVQSAVKAPVSPHHALAAEGLNLLVDPS